MTTSIVSEEKLMRSARKLFEKCKKTPNATVIFTTKTNANLQRIIELARPLGVAAEICCTSTQTISTYLDAKTVEKLKEE